MIKLVTRPLWQWSTGRFVRIIPLEGTTIDEVHFYNGTTNNAIIGVHKTDGNAVIAEIPNILLQSTNTLAVYAVMTDATGETTTERMTFGVLERPKPDDYVYSETEVRSWDRIVNRIEALEGRDGPSDEQIENAVTEYLANNPISAGATKEQAEQIEKNSQDIKVLSDEKLSSAQLDASIEAALSKAKESGEFNGNDGVTPVISLSDIPRGHRISITDADGTKDFDIMDGIDGKDGGNGADGKDGVGITSIEKTSSNGLIDIYTITLSNGNTSSFTVTNGRDGANSSGSGDGGAGADGYSPIAIVTQTSDGAVISITDVNGTTTATVKNGKDGANGVGIESVVKTSTSGLVDTYSITLTNGSTSTFSVTNGKDGADGSAGIDGVSPIATVTQTDNGAIIAITDVRGTTTAKVINGVDGKNGMDGSNGAIFTPTVEEDGTLHWVNDKGLENPVSVNIKGPPGDRGEAGEQGPQGNAGSDGKDGVSVTHEWDGTILRVTSASGTTSVDLKGDRGEQGPQGIQGETGANGADGYSPIRGVDYYTNDDVEAIITEVFNRVINGNEVAY